MTRSPHRFRDGTNRLLLRRSVAAGLTLALAAVACSSTARNDPVAEGPPVTGELSDDPAVPSASPSGGPSPSLGTPVAPGNPTSGPRRRGRGGGSIDYGPPGRGITPDRIKVGFWIVDVSGECNSMGLQGAPGCEGGNEAETKAINDWINQQGGIAGRTLDPVVIVSTIERSTYATQAQAACESFADDHGVFAVLVQPQFSRGDFVSCMAGKNVPVIDAGFWAYDAKDYERYAGFLFQPDRPRPERWVRGMIDGLADQGYFDDGSRLGLVRFDGQPYTRVTNDVLIPRLARYGVTIAEEAALTPPQNTTSGYGAMSSEINNAILRFQTAGVNRVIFFATFGEVQLFFLPAAEAQGFRPRYGFSSLDDPVLLEELAPNSQLRGAVGVGWAPGYDVGSQRDPGGSAAATLCAKILQDAGEEGGTGRNPKCDNAFFFKAAMERAPALNIQGLRAGVAALGSSFEPAATFATRFGQRRHDGPASVRYFLFADDCSCFRYRGKLRSLA